MEFREDVRLGLKGPLMPPLMNGGGCVKTVDDVRRAATSTAGAVVAGSFTPSPRDGNEGDIFWYSETGTLNALGMPNGGIAYLNKYLSQMIAICHNEGKPLIVNIAGFSITDYSEMAELCMEKGVDGIEVNLGCPNVVTGGGKRKPIASYNSVMSREILGIIRYQISQTGGPTAFWVKVSPILNSEELQELAQIVGNNTLIDAVTVINTIPGCYAVDRLGNPRISVGLAGMSGAVVKQIGLGQVWQWRQSLPETVDIIGVGGITSGGDIREYQTAGASAFQVTTELLKRGNFDPRPLENMVETYSCL